MLYLFYVKKRLFQHTCYITVLCKHIERAFKILKHTFISELHHWKHFTKTWKSKRVLEMFKWKKNHRKCNIKGRRFCEENSYIATLKLYTNKKEIFCLVEFFSNFEVLCFCPLSVAIPLNVVFLISVWSEKKNSVNIKYNLLQSFFTDKTFWGLEHIFYKNTTFC